MSMQCQVCKKAEKKYQCPKCDIKYCSVPCFRDHAGGCAEKSGPDSLKTPASQGIAAAASKTSAAASRKRSSMIFLDEEEDVQVPQDVLQRLDTSKELLEVLHNPHLRNFLQHLNSTHNPRGFMRIAMQEPIFVEFADACLKALHPETAAEGQEVSLEEVQKMVEEAIEDE